MATITFNAGKEDEVHYYMDDRLKRTTDEKIIKALKKSDKDFFAIVDGAEGSGKSWFALQWGRYVDPTLNLSRVVFTPEEFKYAVFRAEKQQCIIYDEAFTGMGSRSSLSSINRYLVSLSMQIRQKNLFVILVLPPVFLLDKYFVMFRSKVLVHIYENKGIRGYFRCYNSKKIKSLITIGYKTMSYSTKVWTKFKGRFYGNFALGKELEEEYRNKKGRALEESETMPLSAGQEKYMDQRNILIYILKKKYKLDYNSISELMESYKVKFSLAQVGKVCLDMERKLEKEAEFMGKVADNTPKNAEKRRKNAES